MGLYDRLRGAESPHLKVHAFMAALGEFVRGQMTAQQAIDAFGLSAAEQAELTTLLGRVSMTQETISMGGLVTLTNVGAAYDTTTAGRGLGVARVECGGITGFEFGVSVQKIGSGTQSWQLWDETNAAEVTVIDDADVAGVKQLATTRTFSPPLAAGVRTLRVRAKSTTAADDPVFFGASLLIARIARVTSLELHEVLLLAEEGIAPLTTTAALKARLGV